MDTFDQSSDWTVSNAQMIEPKVHLIRESEDSLSESSREGSSTEGVAHDDVPTREADLSYDQISHGGDVPIQETNSISGGIPYLSPVHRSKRGAREDVTQAQQGYKWVKRVIKVPISHFWSSGAL